jgi:hypothetical protein
MNTLHKLAQQRRAARAAVPSRLGPAPTSSNAQRQAQRHQSPNPTRKASR